MSSSDDGFADSAVLLDSAAQRRQRYQEQREKVEKFAKRHAVAADGPSNIFDFPNRLKQPAAIVISSDEEDDDDDARITPAPKVRNRGRPHVKLDASSDSDCVVIGGVASSLSRKRRRPRIVHDPLLNGYNVRDTVARKEIDKVLSDDPTLKSYLSIASDASKLARSLLRPIAVDVPVPDSPTRSPVRAAELPSLEIPQLSMPSTVPENISFMVNLDPNNDASQTKIVMKSNQDFSRLYKTVSKSRSTPFWFSVEDHELLIDATPEQLGLQDGAHIAIVDVKPTAVMRRRAAKADQSEAPCSDDTIILNVALRNDTIPLKVRRTASFGSIAEKLAQTRDIAGTIVFTLDGEKVEPESTPASLDLEDDDQIDARIV
ncbi:unnamed protein product (mitochondrion) [Plasmodiophora brassicae]|uniref:Rad60/SUMO-like domain-containing protein n=1 Tax=Plasmodiophora brassicae TaxID=37360 RepID=A0A3P3Y8U6_PLABS|nr:unnamed protein product [Plasmodiophora brassicae]